MFSEAISHRNRTFAAAAAVTALGFVLVFAGGGARVDFTTGELGAVTTTVVGVGFAASERMRFRSLALLMAAVVGLQVAADLWRTPSVLGFEVVAVGIAGLFLALRTPVAKTSPAAARAPSERPREGHASWQMHAR